ncbi:MAG: ParB/RepB/Spo0J family partition protein [Erysipelotrichaceae bacterium]|nr:ParB/RepB/Spo0J family partition protein [Erysipelotrichaceae bacterium]
MADNKRLGKGLGELFGGDIDKVLDEITNNEKASSSEISISEIRTNPYQPRKVFDPEKLAELAESIKEHGVFQPVLVRKAIEGYELVAGERRLRAAKIAELEKIPAIVVDFNDTQMMEVSLLENIQREDLSPIEEAEAFKQLVDKVGYTQEELAKRVGKSRTYVTNSLRLLKLPYEVKEMVRKGELSYGQARTILSVEGEERQKALARRAVKEGLTVRQLEKLAARKIVVRKELKKDPYLEEVRHRVEDILGTSVEVGKKAMTIRYNSTEDLNRILEKLGAIEESYE